MRYCNENQININKFLDNSCYVTSVLMTFILKIMLLYLFFFLDISFAKRKSCLFRREL